jgi:ligand-binding sensor domain-containing protein/signal transduction histidine kinase
VFGRNEFRSAVRATLAIACWSLAGLAPFWGFALDPAKSVFQFNCQNWTRQDGLPADKITAVSQTKDGYVWLGTQNGLVRFDGSEFKVVPVALPKVQDQEVMSLCRSGDGGLRLAIKGGGFGCFDGRTFSAVDDPRWLKAGMNPYVILEARNGVAWLGADVAFGSWVKGKAGNTFLDESVGGIVFSLCEDQAGRIWLGTAERGLLQWSQGKFSSMPDEYLKKRNIFALAVDAEGSIWVGTELGLRGYDVLGQPKDIPALTHQINALLVDRHGVLWIGTSGAGLGRYAQGKMTFLRKADGLQSDFVTSLFEDAEGSLWIGLQDGLSQLTDLKFPIFSRQEGIHEGSSHSVAASRSGGVWIAQNGGISHIDSTSVQAYSNDQLHLPNQYVRLVFEAGNGDLYLDDGSRNIAVRSGDTLSILYQGELWCDGFAEDAEGVLLAVGTTLNRVRDGKLQPYAFKSAKPDFNWIHGLSVARDDAIWVACDNGVYRVKDGSFQHWSTANGLTSDHVHFVCEDVDGSVWAGLPTGLARIKDNQARSIKLDDGLFDDRVCAIVPDDHGFLWFMSGHGIFRAARQSLNDFADGKARRVQSEPFVGLESVKFTDRTDQGYSGCKTADGRIWFPNPLGVVMIDPAGYFTNPVAPSVFVHEVRVNGEKLEGEASAVLRPGDRNVEFFFTALSYIAPRKMRVRYQLEGFDPDWIEAEAHRSVRYNNLPAGRYRFWIQACNADGVWNTIGAEFRIELPPLFYERVWFRMLCALPVVLALLGAFRWKFRRMEIRERKLQEQNDLLEAKVGKRTAELASANDSLKDEIRQRAQFQAELEARKHQLEGEIEERKRMELEVEKTHRTLIDVSRKAGQAEVASSVLHNVGNVLNSVNVATNLISERLAKLRVPNVRKTAELLQKQRARLGEWLTEDARGRQLPDYLEALGQQLEEEQAHLLKEVGGLVSNVEHIKEIIVMQQNYTKVAGVAESIAPAELAESALKMEAGGFSRHGISVVRDYAELPPMIVDKHRVLQILVNLLHNAKYACDAARRPDKQVVVRITPAMPDQVRFEVQDNGVGIAPEHMKRLFTHGFTTRKNGHGFGLHSSALASREIGGTLTVHSDGVDQGARFTLMLPKLPKGLTGEPG